MSGKSARHEAVVAVTSYKPEKTTLKKEGRSLPFSFGANVFNDHVMRAKLPKDIYLSLKKTIEENAPLNPSLADIVASAMKEWALEKGATHYTHVFFPLTGLTAEKHDSFLVPDDNGGALIQFDGKALIKGEPDASSFPNGGLRATFEARGYTAWDITSPAYIMETLNTTTLCIPTVFVSWTGDALDQKIPIMRSQQALNKHVTRILRLFGHTDISPLSTMIGAEQEYFLIDRNFFYARPDIISAGRTIFGAPSPKGQDSSGHYFGQIPQRVLSFMLEVEQRLLKLGVPIKTRHNEVAPGQYEIAPLHEPANIATDHQQLVMSTLKQVARRHGMACLLHEKPFAGINGSGKHLNFSIGNRTQGNLLDPGETPHENVQFLVFCAAVIQAVHKHRNLLRAVISSASNDLRLGGHEAPPAIMSIFLSDELTQVFKQIQRGEAGCGRNKETIVLGIDSLPPLPKDTGDRNRTSPFAFTQNRFEFRAVGSQQSISAPIVVLNTILTEALDDIATRLENLSGGGQKELTKAIQTVIKDVMDEHGSIIFNGDGYSSEWHEEAEKLGLASIKTSPEAIATLGNKEVVKMFETYGVLSKRELTSRVDIYLEQYSQAIRVEADLAFSMAIKIIYPAALRYQKELAETALAMKALGKNSESPVLNFITQCIDDLYLSIHGLRGLLDNSRPDKLNVRDCAQFYCDEVVPALRKLRTHVDSIEKIIDDSLWDLPTYEEMLFIK